MLQKRKLRDYIWILYNIETILCEIIGRDDKCYHSSKETSNSSSSIFIV